ncbi:hypothetical protein ACU4GA_27310 [Methylobacterium oryzae CBMB20]
MRKQLEEAAATSGRPLIHEIEHRLERAFWLDRLEAWEDDVFANDANKEIGEALKLAAALASRFAESSWRESPLARKMLTLTLYKTLVLAFDQIDEEQQASDLEGEDQKNLERSATFIASLAVAQATGRKVSDKARADWREMATGGPKIPDPSLWPSE